MGRCTTCQIAVRFDINYFQNLLRKQSLLFFVFAKRDLNVLFSLGSSRLNQDGFDLRFRISHSNISSLATKTSKFDKSLVVK